LSELEEYISNLITVLAYKRGDPHPAISSVPFERLNNKEFASKDLAIDAPIDHEIMEATTVDNDTMGQDDNNYNFIEAKELYANY